MGFLQKVLILVASGIAIICALAALGRSKPLFEGSNVPDSSKAQLACNFIALFIVSGLAIFVFVTLCCPCPDLVMGIVAAVAGGAYCFFMIVAYGSGYKPVIDADLIVLPTLFEWLFGGIFVGSGLLLIGLSAALS